VEEVKVLLGTVLVLLGGLGTVLVLLVGLVVWLELQLGLLGSQLAEYGRCCLV